ncbi:MAG: hypothetical protein H0Z30_03475 [Candidatus Marinimicrobia bacterium]|nr:hypothetical protein [Candidatus Neomarinimicrobiota bacterium]
MRGIERRLRNNCFPDILRIMLEKLKLIVVSNSLRLKLFISGAYKSVN